MLVAGFLVAGILFMAVFAFLYVKYEGIVDRRMSGPLFNNSAKIYARPRTVEVGQNFRASEIADYLDVPATASRAKRAIPPSDAFALSGSSLEVMPGEESFHAPRP